MKLAKKIIFIMLLCGVFNPTVVKAGDTFNIDTAHSTAIFRIKHLGVSYSYGRFNDIQGTYVIDKNDVAKNSVEVTIKVDSIDTNHEKRDGHLKSPDFFNAKAFPVITFKGTSFKPASPGVIIVTGDLTMHGVTKPINLQMSMTGAAKDPWGGFRTGFEGNTTIKRSDFGMNFMQGGIGDGVTIMLSIEGLQKK